MGNLKNKLKFVHLVLGRFENVMREYGPCILPNGSKTVLFTMDMTSDGKFNEWFELLSIPTCNQPIIWLRSNGGKWFDNLAENLAENSAEPIITEGILNLCRLVK